MRTLLIGALAANLAGCSLYLQPPPEYDYPHPGELTVQKADPHKVHFLCQNPRSSGCAYVRPDHCLVIIANIGRDNELIRHEQAHCNGWPADHPGGRL